MKFLVLILVLQKRGKFHITNLIARNLSDNIEIISKSLATLTRLIR
jgi:hypothetical protein